MNLATSPRTAIAVAAATAIALSASGVAAASPPGASVVLDQPDGFADPFTGAAAASAVAARGSVSADGRYVVFFSDSDGLSDRDDDRAFNVFRKDRVTGAVELVSVATNGTPADGDSYDAHISDDGDRVVFISAATTLAPGVTNGLQHVYVRDVAAGTTTLVSRADGASGAPVQAHQPAISGDGMTVAFVTQAPTVAADDNTVEDVYARRLATDETILVSRPSGMSPVGSSPSSEPSVNSDGKRIAFASGARLVAFDNNSRTDVYRRTFNANGTTTTDLISVRDATEAPGGAESSQPAISPAGDAVAFRSYAADLDKDVADENAGQSDVFLFNGGDQQSLSASAYGGGGTAISDQPDVGGAPGALRVVFQSLATPPGVDAQPVPQVLVADAVTGAIRVVSRAADEKPGDRPSMSPSLSSDGRVVAYGTQAGNLGGGIGGDQPDVAARVLDGGGNELVSAPAAGPLVEDLDEVALRTHTGSLTPDGRFAVFAAGHDGLGVADRERHVFRRDARTGRTVLVDRADGPAGAPASAAYDPSASADGRVVAFVTHDALDPADRNGKLDVYVRDLDAGTTRLVSRTPTGAAGDGISELPAVSADGRRIAFESDATNLGDGDTDADYDIHVLDLESGAMTLASRAAEPADADAFFPAIDADGSVVTFTSRAKNLDAADTDGSRDVFVRDLEAGTTRLVSRRTDGSKQALVSDESTVSADGRRVAFLSDAALDADTDMTPDVYVHDRVAGTTSLVSRATGAAGVKSDRGSYTPVISADGSAVAFATEATNLGGPAGTVYVRRLDDATTTPTAVGEAGALSADGACLALTSSTPPLVRGTDHDRVVLFAVRSTCEIETGAAQQPSGGPGPVTDAGAPVLRGLRLSHSRFRVGPASTATAARLGRGTVVRYRLDRAATVTLTIRRRAGKRWVRKGALQRRSAAGANRVAFSGRIGRRALKPGRFKLVARARDAAGRTSAPRAVRFRVTGR